MGDSAVTERGLVGTFAGFPPSGRMLCPVCDYSLVGLPVVHQCPECGFAWDEGTHVWILTQKRRNRWKLVAAVLYGVIAVNELFDAIGPNGRFVDYVGVFGFGVGSLAFYILRGRDGIVLSKTGFTICFAGRWYQPIGWDGITHVEVSSMGKRSATATFRSRGGKKAACSGAFDTVDDARDCQRVAEAMISAAHVSRANIERAQN